MRRPARPHVRLAPVPVPLDEADREFVRTTFTSAPSGPHRSKHCSECTGRVCFDERWDAFFCPSCDVWLEAACGARRCAFCGGRPARPSGRVRRRRR